MSFLIVGYGKRVENFILPSLLISKKNFYITGRSNEKIIKLLQKYNLPNNHHLQLSELTSLNITIENIFISIPSKNYLEYFQLLELINKNNKINYYFDTPFISPIKNLLIINKRKNIYMLEDWQFKPINNLLTSISNDYPLEKLSKIVFYKSSYLYHGLALIKSFLDSNVNYAFKKKKNNLNIYSFKIGDVNCKMTEKRDYGNCYSYFEFKSIVLIDDENNKNNAIPSFKNKKIFKVKREFIDGVLESISVIDDKKKIIYKNNFNIKNEDHIFFKNKNYEDQEKILSLVLIVDKFLKYKVTQNIYDMFVFYYLNKLKIFHKYLFNNYILKIVIFFKKII